MVVATEERGFEKTSSLIDDQVLELKMDI